MRDTPTLSWEQRVLSRDALREQRLRWRRDGLRVVATNGCFDLLHLGHLTYLERARDLGDVLIVGLNSDASVRALKGPQRPLIPEDERAAALAALRCVSAVHIFHEIDATSFLEVVDPEIYVKGGDYSLENINQDERRLIEKAGAQLHLIAGAPHHSTTELIQKIRSLTHP